MDEQADILMKNRSHRHRLRGAGHRNLLPPRLRLSSRASCRFIAVGIRRPTTALLT
jgi:hypothetical protein